MKNAAIDPVELSAQLIRCASVTPADDGAIAVVEGPLTDAGFECTRIDRGGITNLFARWGAKGHARTFGFNGHTDVVPVGDVTSWTQDPFCGNVVDGELWGRGATDMKTGVAAFVAAAIDLVTTAPPDGAIIITITGDEEGDAVDGTTAILDWMSAADEHMSACLVGEPTCPNFMGETIKIGRRGSMNVGLTATGIQGHAAYPHRAKNPVTAMAQLVGILSSHVLDEGTAHFDPSTVTLTSFDTGNKASNVIPELCTAMVNVRFNDAHSSESVERWIVDSMALVEESTGVRFSHATRVSGESFLTPPGELSTLVTSAVATVTGTTPELSTSGGTSDARFIKDHCPVVEFGLVGKTMHQVDERVEVQQIEQLRDVYAQILRQYFAQ